MTRRERSGFTLIEVLVALAVIGIAFAALGLVQVTNLRATTTARLATDTKAAANAELERLTALVLRIESSQFAFSSYFWRCPDVDTNIPSGADAPLSWTALGFGTGVNPCEGTSQYFGGDVVVTYAIAGLPGIEGEGVVSISVTATHQRQGTVSLTIGDRISCYDVFPTPTADTPAPCPLPVDSDDAAPQFRAG